MMTHPPILGLRFYSHALEVIPGQAPIFVHHGLEETCSDFDYIFSPLFVSLRECVYICQRGFGYIEDSELAERMYTERIGELDGFQLRSGSELTEYGRHISDDWNALIVFKKPHPEIADLVALAKGIMTGNPDTFQTQESVVALFNNFDGVFWEIFTKRQDWVRTLVETHREDARLDMKIVNFGADYPDPGRSGAHLIAPPPDWPNAQEMSSARS